MLTWGLALCLEPQPSVRVAVGGTASASVVGVRVASASISNLIKSVNYSRRVTVAAASILTNYHVNDIP